MRYDEWEILGFIWCALMLGFIGIALLWRWYSDRRPLSRDPHYRSVQSGKAAMRQMEWRQ